MKKKVLITSSVLLLFTVGRGTGLLVNNPCWRVNTIFRLQETSNSPILKRTRKK